MPGHLRPHVLAFYNFARAADDIADSSNLGADEKIHLLDQCEDILLGKSPDSDNAVFATTMRDSLAETGVSSRSCQDLLQAFRLDVVKSRYQDWADLIGYCRLSAAPVGRYMIDLHGGATQGYAASDSLCMALQILNHIQDCNDDYEKLSRVYLPMNWMAEAGMAESDLAAKTCSPALRKVLNWTLIGVDALLADSGAMVISIKSTRLALESAVINAIAIELKNKLARTDPLVAHVTLNNLERAKCAAGGLIAGMTARL